MENVNINFANVEVKIQELENYTQQNLVLEVENAYADLFLLLEGAEGVFKDEYIIALENEKQMILGFVDYIKSIYLLIQKSSIEFETVDKIHAEKKIQENL